jgi:TolB-like protein/Tfp pilus assembly protein PilF
MVTEQGAVKVLDFGIAKPLSLGRHAVDTPDLTATGTLLGTAAYMSPEQIRGRALDQRSDIWAFGCVLYEMLTGKKAFYRETLADTLSAILEYEPDWNAVPPELPVGVRALVRSALEKDVEQRPAEIVDARREIERALSETRSSASQTRGSTTRGEVQSSRITETDVTSERIRSLAVLPLANLSGDPDQEFFSDGMTEALITDLAKIGALKVISRTSVMRYKGADKSLPEIAAELGVDAVIEGSVLRAGDEIRVTSQLIHAASDTHIWADSYDRRLSDVLNLQRELARAIVAEVKAKLSPEEERLLKPERSIDPRAHDEYLRGRYHLHKVTADAMETAIGYFRRAIEIDPTHAAAHAGMADAYMIQGSWLKAVPLGTAIVRGKAAAKKALELDPTLGEAHASLGYAATFYDWDWPAAESAYQLAIASNPNDSLTRMYYCWYLAAQARTDEANAQMRVAHRLDPLSAWVGSNVAIPPFLSGRYDEAIQICRRALELDPDFPEANWVLGTCLAASGRYDEAVETFRATLEHGKEYVGWLGYALALSGDTASAREILEELEKMRPQGKASADDIARVHIALGQLDQAFDWLDRALDERALFVIYLKVHPCYAPLRSDERYRRCLERLGLSD